MMSVIDRRRGSGTHSPRAGVRRPPPALTEAQIAALRRLVVHHALTAEQARVVHEALAEANRPAGARRWFAEIAGYLGGALVLGGGALLLGTSWDRLMDASRSALLAAITLVLAVAGLVIAGGPAGLVDAAHRGSPVRRRVASALFALGSGTAAASAGVLATDRPWVAAGAVGLASAAVGYFLAQGVFGALAIEAFGVVLAVSFVAEDVGATPLRVATAMVATGVALAVLTELGWLVPRDVALGGAAGIALIGGQQPLTQDGTAVWAYGLTFAVGMACFALYWLRESSALLVMGVIGLAVAVPEAVWDLTNGAIGGAAVLLVAGATLLVASAIGLRLWRVRNPGDPA